MNMKFHVVLEPQPEGGFTAACVEIPGAISEGETEEEALENVSDAIQMILVHRRADAEATARREHALLRTVDVDAEAPT
jgi:predicted RNase H-like HicB family nuclease